MIACQCHKVGMKVWIFLLIIKMKMLSTWKTLKIMIPFDTKIQVRGDMLLSQTVEVLFFKLNI